MAAPTARKRSTQQEKSVEVTLSEPQAKKYVVRFDADDEDAALSNVYITKAALKELGDPDAIHIVITAA